MPFVFLTVPVELFVVVFTLYCSFGRNFYSLVYCTKDCFVWFCTAPLSLSFVVLKEAVIFFATKTSFVRNSDGVVVGKSSRGCFFRCKCNRDVC